MNDIAAHIVQVIVVLIQRQHLGDAVAEIHDCCQRFRPCCADAAERPAGQLPPGRRLRRGGLPSSSGVLRLLPAQAACGCSCSVVAGSSTGNAAKDGEVSNSVAAQTVCTVDAASHLTCCEQAGDDLALLVQHLGVGVDLQAAHGVMDTGGDLHSVVGSGVQGVGEAGAAEVGVILGLNVAVPLLHGLCEGSGIDAHSLAQLLVGSAGDGVALLDVALNDAGSIDHGLIDDQPAVAAGLSDLSGRDDVTGADLVDEALAFLVDEDSAVAAQALGDEGSGVGLNGGVDLDLVHVHGSSADGLSHLDALALDAGGRWWS